MRMKRTGRRLAPIRCIAGRITAATFALWIVGAALGYPSSAAAAWPDPVTVSAPSATPTTPIRHLVVMIQRGHSFDNYFGTRRNVDGIPAGACLPAAKRNDPAGPAPCVAPFALGPDGSDRQLYPSPQADQTSINGGMMNGFVRAQALHGSNGTIAMGFYPPTSIPTLTAVAAGGVLFDRWFAAMPGGSIGNALAAVAGQATTNPERVPAGGWDDVPTIFDRLQSAGVTWGIYVQHFDPSVTIRTATPRQRAAGQVAAVPVLALSRYLDNPTLRSHIVDMDRYFVDLADGTLPAVSFLVTTQTTEAPPAGPARGQLAVRDAVNALVASSAWQHSAFLLTYTDSGGWYDHVPPVTVAGRRTGLRVPALLISPYARPGAVNSTTLTSAGVLRFIEQNWNLAPLTESDRVASSIGVGFDFTASPRPAALLGLPGAISPPRQPSSSILYTGYGLALVVGGACAAWATLASRRARRRAHPTAGAS